MTADDVDAQRHAEEVAWHREFDRVMRREWPLTWSIWAAPMRWSAFLTPEGLRTAEWAVKVLQDFLGDDFLQRIVDAEAEHALLSPGILTTLCPIVDGQRVYADLFRLAAQLSLLHASAGRLRQTMCTNIKDPTAWTHALIQLEMSALALRDGWRSAFERKLAVGNRKSDVHLEKGSETLRVEITSVGESGPEREADKFFMQVRMQLMAIELRYGVHVYGQVGQPVPADIAAFWLREITVAAAATAQDGRDRKMSGGSGGQVRVTTGQLGANQTLLEGAPVTTDTWQRVDLRITGKGGKTEGAEPLWLRLQDHAGMWLLTPFAHMSLADKLASLAPRLRETIEMYPHIAGIILSPGPMWRQSGPDEETCELPGVEGAVALRRPLKVGRIRETVIVARSRAPDDGWTAFRDWYAQEGTWLDWALAQLDKPPLDALVHQAVNASGKRTT